jgi:hypothetical protein
MLPPSSGLKGKPSKKADLSAHFTLGFLLGLLWAYYLKKVRLKLQLWELKLSVTGIL